MMNNSSLEMCSYAFHGNIQSKCISIKHMNWNRKIEWDPLNGEKIFSANCMWVQLRVLFVIYNVQCSMFNVPMKCIQELLDYCVRNIWCLGCLLHLILSHFSFHRSLGPPSLFAESANGQKSECIVRAMIKVENLQSNNNRENELHFTCIIIIIINWKT